MLKFLRKLVWWPSTPPPTAEGTARIQEDLRKAVLDYQSSMAREQWLRATNNHWHHQARNFYADPAAAVLNAVMDAQCKAHIPMFNEQKPEVDRNSDAIDVDFEVVPEPKRLIGDGS